MALIASIRRHLVKSWMPNIKAEQPSEAKHADIAACPIVFQRPETPHQHLSNINGRILECTPDISSIPANTNFIVEST